MNDVPTATAQSSTLGEAIPASGTPNQGFRGDQKPRKWDRLGLVLAWILILIGIVLWAWKPTESSEDGLEAEIPAGLLLTAQDEMVGKLALGLRSFGVAATLPPMQQAEPLATGGVAQRLAYAILAAEILGIEQAREELESILSESGEDPVTRLLLPAVESVFDAVEAGEAAPVSSIELLEDRLGWFGRLADAIGRPEAIAKVESDSESGVLALLTLIGLMFVFGLLGFVGLIVLLSLGLTGRIASKVIPMSRHGIYAETFAIWLLLMLLIQIAMGFLAPAGFGMIASTVGFFLSLSVLGWPVLRGIEWQAVRKDIGLERPRFLDLPAGVASWAMALPFLAVGAIITFVLMIVVQLLTNETPQPSHPAQQATVNAGAWDLFQIFLLATVAAPVVEEIMFRGVLLSHLRGAMKRWAAPVAIALAAIVSSVIFAAIHPQGLIFIPPLAGLGIGFCIAREWRGSLIPAMVAHGLSNALVMTLNVVLFSS